MPRYGLIPRQLVDDGLINAMFAQNTPGVVVGQLHHASIAFSTALELPDLKAFSAPQVEILYGRQCVHSSACDGTHIDVVQ